MPKIAKELSALAVKNLKHPGSATPGNAVFAVGGVAGLMLQITPGGGRSWLLRTMVNGKRREIGLGGHDVSLGEARERARATKGEIRNGIDPLQQKRDRRKAAIAAAKRHLTFRDAVDKFLAATEVEFRNEKHRKQWRSTLDNYAMPVIGNLAVSEVTRDHTYKILEPIWTTKTETATRLRQRIERVLDWAKAHGHREGDNPAAWKGNLNAMLSKPSKVATVDNQPAVQLKDAPTWFAALRKRDGTGARALEFVTLTAARSGEVRGMEFSEIDWKAKLWTVPASRMKMKKQHTVTLSDAAIAILTAMKDAATADSKYVFPAIRGGMLSDMTLSATMKRMHESEIEAGRTGWLDKHSGRPAVPHGLRSTFSDWVGDMSDYPRDMREFALAHAISNDVEASYRRETMVEKRRAMMADWADFLGV
ncbi:Integrase [Mesorhizobium albiziae]|uniref:Integrase n=1 Tax=Neomesorhizobium albiziae TaxID=335020 RepID=A0A1I4DW07_9HYPH|nr:site-specific integrase [Mesorhizobium albiziae]GLS33747.1 integrase [Mesorhizobium albiziae]SFK96266.1 Integrase [Mesorhizobium albiziae]